MSNPIKYSDLIVPDSSLSDLMSQLQSIQSEYEKLSSTVQANAQKVAASTKNLSSATEHQQEAIRSAASEADKLAKKQEQLERSMSENAKIMTQLNLQLQKNNAQTKLTIQSNSAAEGSIAKLRAEYKLLLTQYENLTQELREGKMGQAMSSQLRDMSEKLQQFNAQVGKSSGITGMRTALAGLNTAASQIVRELPSLAISTEQFFLAISNNIPIYVDAIQRVQAENKQLIAQGQPAQNTLKAVMKSFISWQSLIVVGITLLTRYGGEIVEWVGNLIKGEKALDSTSKAAKEFNSVMSDITSKSTEVVAEIETLYAITQDHTRSLEEQTNAAGILIDKYGDFLYLLDEEGTLAGESATAIDQLTEAMKRNYIARGILEQIVEKKIELSETEAKAAEKADELAGKVDYAKYLQGSSALGGLFANWITGYSRLSRETGELTEKSDTLRKVITELEKSLNPSDLEDPLTYFSDAAKAEREYTKLKREEEDTRIELMAEGEEKEVKIAETAIDRRIEDLRYEIATNKKLLPESVEAINSTIKNLELEKEQTVAEIRQKYRDEEAKALSDMEAEVAKMEQNAAKITEANAKKAAKARVNAAKGAEKAAEKLYKAKNIEELYKAELALYDLEYDLRLSQIDLMDETEDEKTKLRLQAERDRWQKILDFNTNVSQMLSDEELEILRNLIAKANQEIAKVGPRDIYDILGLNVTDEQKDAIKEAMGSTVDSINEIIDSYAALADAAVDAADAQVDAAKSALDAEIEARNNGYANNVSQAQKELELARQTQQKALADQKKAQQAQNNLATISQAVDLVSASAKIWGQLGFPWAIPALAVMWGSFAYAKIKANQVAKTAKYGDGMVEYLDYGGSHASGNDIDFGVKKDGTRRRVERGEMVAVINRRNVNKYGRNAISDIVSSINRGTFEAQFGSTFMGLTPENRPTVDLSVVEDKLGVLVSQGRNRIVTVNGKTIEYYKNNKRIIKN